MFLKWQERKLLQQQFDKLLNKTFFKRLYNQAKLDQIEKLNTSNHVDFWNHIKSLGPSKRRGIPDAVWLDGTLNSDQDVVLNKWTNDFKELFNKPDAKGQHSVRFLSRKKCRF